MKSIGAGRQADVYVKDGQALKVYKEWVSVEQIQYEADVSQKVAEVCKYAPKFFGLEQQDGKYVLQLEYIQGKMLTTTMKGNLLQLKKYAQGLAKLHREIHGYAIPGLRTAKDKFEGSLNRYQDINADNVNKLMEFLQNSKEESLCHGDMHPENVMVSENGEMRVIDWVDAYCGDPLSDVARTYYLLKHGTPPGKRSGFGQIMEKQAGELIGREYLKSYFKGKPTPMKDLNMWGLIIRIHRYWEGIEEEKADLQKSIAFGVHKLLEV